MKPIIAFFEIEPHEEEYFRKKFPTYVLRFFSEPLNAETMKHATDAEIVSVFVYSQVDRTVLNHLPKVALITTRSMGFDHIDLAACAARGIVVSNVPAYGERTVAEHTFALILALSRKIFQAYERTEKAVFDYRGLEGFDLKGKTIGIIGTGRIGRTVARIARGFDMCILATDPFPNEEAAKEIGYEYVSLTELLAVSDIITLHVPYTKENHHLINGQNILSVRPGALLVNTARGALLDTKALLDALEKKIIAGAGLDVLEEECAIREERELLLENTQRKCDLATLVRNHLLIERDDVIITPHIAWQSREAIKKILSTTVENIEAFRAGKPINVVKG